MYMHQAHTAEDNLYRRCLADKFPNIEQNDYVECGRNVYN